jgi:hypothetical protein
VAPHIHPCQRYTPPVLPLMRLPPLAHSVVLGSCLTGLPALLGWLTLCPYLDRCCYNTYKHLFAHLTCLFTPWLAQAHSR